MLRYHYLSPAFTHLSLSHFKRPVIFTDSSLYYPSVVRQQHSKRDSYEDLLLNAHFRHCFSISYSCSHYSLLLPPSMSIFENHTNITYRCFTPTPTPKLLLYTPLFRIKTRMLVKYLIFAGTGISRQCFPSLVNPNHQLSCNHSQRPRREHGTSNPHPCTCHPSIFHRTGQEVHIFPPFHKSSSLLIIYFYIYDLHLKTFYTHVLAEKVNSTPVFLLLSSPPSFLA